jgi:hypothetical protein
VLRPYLPQPESLYGVEHGNEHNMWESYPDYLDLRDRNRSFDGLAGYSIDQVGLDAGENPTLAWACSVTGNYFDVLRLHPHRGHFFHASDEHGPNSAPYIVLSYSYWHTHFMDDRGVVGRVVRVNKHPFTIADVAPPVFRGTLVFGAPAIFVPIVDQEQVEGKYTLDVRGTPHRVHDAGSPQAGSHSATGCHRSQLDWRILERTYPKERGATTFVLARPGLYGNYVGGPMRAFVAGLMLLAGLTRSLRRGQAARRGGGLPSGTCCWSRRLPFVPCW